MLIVLKESPSREYIEGILELMHRALLAIDLPSGDKHLRTTSRKDRKAIRLNANNRLALSSRTDNIFSYGFILPREHSLTSIEQYIIWQFKDIVKSENEDNTPIFINYPAKRIEDIPSELIDVWLEEVVKQVHLINGGTKRDSHNPLVYRAAVDLD